MMGCQVDNLTLEETLETVERFIRSGRPHQHVATNVDKLVKASREQQLRGIINGCDLASADGMPGVWAARLLRRPLKERVAGIDPFEARIARAADRRWRVFLLGARSDVVQALRERYRQRWPALAIVGCRDGYRQGEQEELALVEQIRASGADLLFVAISSPKKEQFLGRHQAAMQVPFAMGVGGGFDVAAGLVRRAPRWMRQAGLEWLFRLLQEPRRMARRYFIDDVAFVWLLIKEVARRQGTISLSAGSPAGL